MIAAARSSGHAVAGEFSAVLDDADTALRDTPDLPLTSFATFTAVGAAALLEQPRQAEDLARRVRPNAFLHDVTPLALATARAQDPDPTIPASQLAEAARRVRGDIPHEHGEYVALFGWFRYRLGDTDRALTLLDHAFTRSLSVLPIHVVHQLRPTADNNWTSTCQDYSLRQMSPDWRRAASARMPELAAEEIDFWTSA